MREEVNTCEPKEEGALSDAVQRPCEQRVDDGDAAKEG